MSASDKSSGTQPALPSSSDTGPKSKDGEMLLPTPHSQEPGWTPDGDQDPQHRPYQDGQHRLWGVGQVIHTLLPTPTEGDHKSSGSRNLPGSNAHPGTSLTDAIRSDRISSAAGSPVSPSAPQDDEEVRTMTDTSGRSSEGSSLKWNPATWSSRTSLVCSLQDGEWVIEQGSLFGTTPLATFSETYPRWGSMHDGRVFAHPTPERVTNESASSSLQTPGASAAGYSSRGGDRKDEKLLAGQVKDLLHTPTTGDTAPTYDHRASPGYTRAIPVPNLAAQVDDLLPTPDTTHGRKSTRTAPLLPGAVEELLPTPKTPTGGSEKRAGRQARGSGGEDLEARLRSIGDHTEPPSEGGNE
jgi:hypothetical protein